MKVLLINIDSKIQNIALEKMRIFYNNKGFEVEISRTFKKGYNKIFASCIFTENYHKAKHFQKLGAVIGGSGVDLITKLPTEIENINPKINLDFASRGCVRNCSFCIVPKKEGKIYADKDLYDIWDGKSKNITLLDNNILAMPEHFKLIISQAKKHNLRLDFNQGLDIRLITDELAYLLSTVRIKEYRFALDNYSLIPTVNEKLKILRKYMPKKYFFFYVLVYKNTDISEDLERLNFIRKNNCRAYVQSFNNEKLSFEKYRMKDWSNQRWHFSKLTFKQYLKYYQKKHPKGKIQELLYPTPTIDFCWA